MSDKVVNVYVGECFSDGAQVGGDGNTYGLTLTGNKLKLVENGQQSEVDLPAGGGGGSAELPKETKDKIDELSKYGYIIKALGTALPVEKEVYIDPVNNIVMYVSGDGSLERPYAIHFVGGGSYPRNLPYFLNFPTNSSGENITQHHDFAIIIYDGQIFNVLGQEVTYHASDYSLDMSKVPIGIHSFSLINA